MRDLPRVGDVLQRDGRPWYVHALYRDEAGAWLVDGWWLDVVEMEDGEAKTERRVVYLDDLPEQER